MDKLPRLFSLPRIEVPWWDQRLFDTASTVVAVSPVSKSILIFSIVNRESQLSPIVHHINVLGSPLLSSIRRAQIIRSTICRFSSEIHIASL